MLLHFDKFISSMLCNGNGIGFQNQYQNKPKNQSGQSFLLIHISFSCLNALSFVDADEDNSIGAEVRG